MAKSKSSQIREPHPDAAKVQSKRNHKKREVKEKQKAYEESHSFGLDKHEVIYEKESQDRSASIHENIGSTQNSSGLTLRSKKRKNTDKRPIETNHKNAVRYMENIFGNRTSDFCISAGKIKIDEAEIDISVPCKMIKSKASYQTIVPLYPSKILIVPMWSKEQPIKSFPKNEEKILKEEQQVSVSDKQDEECQTSKNMKSTTNVFEKSPIDPNKSILSALLMHHFTMNYCFCSK